MVRPVNSTSSTITTVRPVGSKSMCEACSTGASGRMDDVVAVEADVEVAERHVGVEQLLEHAVQALGQERAATVDADERRSGNAGVALDDLVRDTRERSIDVLLVEDDLLTASHLFLPGLAGPG